MGRISVLGEGCFISPYLFVYLWLISYLSTRSELNSRWFNSNQQMEGEYRSAYPIKERESIETFPTVSSTSKLCKQAVLDNGWTWGWVPGKGLWTVLPLLFFCSEICWQSKFLRLVFIALSDQPKMYFSCFHSQSFPSFLSKEDLVPFLC